MKIIKIYVFYIFSSIVKFSFLLNSKKLILKHFLKLILILFVSKCKLKENSVSSYNKHHLDVFLWIHCEFIEKHEPTNEFTVESPV